MNRVISVFSNALLFTLLIRFCYFKYVVKDIVCNKSWINKLFQMFYQRYGIGNLCVITYQMVL